MSFLICVLIAYLGCQVTRKHPIETVFFSQKKGFNSSVLRWHDVPHAESEVRCKAYCRAALRFRPGEKERGVRQLGQQWQPAYLWHHRGAKPQVSTTLISKQVSTISPVEKSFRLRFYTDAEAYTACQCHASLA